MAKDTGNLPDNNVFKGITSTSDAAAEFARQLQAYADFVASLQNPVFEGSFTSDNIFGAAQRVNALQDMLLAWLAQPNL